MNLTNNPQGLNKKLLTQIVTLILNYKKPSKIVLFGSRVNKEFKKTSDIDIAIFGKGWKDRDINIIKNKLDEFIKTPLKFDVINFYDIRKSTLKKNILKNGMIIYKSQKSNRGS